MEKIVPFAKHFHEKIEKMQLWALALGCVTRFFDPSKRVVNLNCK